MYKYVSREESLTVHCKVLKIKVKIDKENNVWISYGFTHSSVLIHSLTHTHMRTHTHFQKQNTQSHMLIRGCDWV